MLWDLIKLFNLPVLVLHGLIYLKHLAYAWHVVAYCSGFVSHVMGCSSLLRWSMQLFPNHLFGFSSHSTKCSKGCHLENDMSGSSVGLTVPYANVLFNFSFIFFPSSPKSLFGIIFLHFSLLIYAWLPLCLDSDPYYKFFFLSLYFYSESCFFGCSWE